jgi:hypothetical protein
MSSRPERLQGLYQDLLSVLPPWMFGVEIIPIDGRMWIYITDHREDAQDAVIETIHEHQCDLQVCDVVAKLMYREAANARRDGEHSVRAAVRSALGILPTS